MNELRPLCPVQKEQERAKKTRRHEGGKTQPRSTVPVGDLLADIIDELASLADLPRSAPAASQNEPDEITEWARILNVKLDDASLVLPGASPNNAPTALAHNAIRRLWRIGRLLEGLQGRLPVNTL